MNQLEQFITVILGLGGVIAVTSYFLGSWRNGSSANTTEAIQNLQSLTQTLEKKLDLTQEDLRIATDKITVLEAKVVILTKDNTSLQELIIKALLGYFEEHPELAKEEKHRAKL